MKDRHRRHLSRHKHTSHQDEERHSHSKDRHRKHHHHHRRSRSESVEEERKCKKRKHKAKEAEDVVQRPTNHKSIPAESSSDEEPNSCNKQKNSGSLAHNLIPKSRWETEEEKVPERQKPANDKGFMPKRQISAERGAPKWGKQNENNGGAKKSVENKAKPDFSLSGKLAEEVNTYNGVVIKYSEPTEARKPKRRWRLYPFKGDDVLPTLYIHRQSAYLIGRDRKVVDLPVDHPSCSKQHAVLQYRVVPYTRDDGTKGQRVRPYLIDLESANGTYVNNQKIETRKYVELIERDVIKFAYSSREYVLLHEHSKDDELDDNVLVKNEDDQ